MEPLDDDCYRIVPDTVQNLFFIERWHDSIKEWVRIPAVKYTSRYPAKQFIKRRGGTLVQGV